MLPDNPVLNVLQYLTSQLKPEFKERICTRQWKSRNYPKTPYRKKSFSALCRLCFLAWRSVTLVGITHPLTFPWAQTNCNKSPLVQPSLLSNLSQEDERSLFYCRGGFPWKQQQSRHDRMGILLLFGVTEDDWTCSVVCVCVCLSRRLDWFIRKLSKDE